MTFLNENMEYNTIDNSYTNEKEVSLMNETIKTILSRRSIRKYTGQQISDDELDMILEAAKYAPSGSNSQSRHFIVLQNKEKLLDLNAYIRAAFKDYPVGESTYRSIRAGKTAAEHDEYNFYYHAPTLIIVSDEENYGNAMADSACAIENIMLAAYSLDLGTCWINQVRWMRDDPFVKKFMFESGMPDNHTVFGSVAIGYRDGKLPAALPRKEKNVTIIK